MGRFGNAVSRRLATKLTNTILGYDKRGRPIRRMGGPGCLITVIFLLLIFSLGIVLAFAIIK